MTTAEGGGREHEPSHRIATLSRARIHLHRAPATASPPATSPAPPPLFHSLRDAASFGVAAVRLPTASPTNIVTQPHAHVADFSENTFQTLTRMQIRID